MNRFFILLALVFTAYTASNAQEAKSSNEIFTIVDVMPEFPGGQKALNNFIGVNLQYPSEAKAKQQSGTVLSSFIVEPDGNISSIKILRGVGYGCDDEVIRVIRLMPKWEPGIKNNKAVRVQMNLPIDFTLE